MPGIIIITNNPMTNNSIKSGEIIYKKEWRHLDTLKAARDEIHKGRTLLTHPISGSIKPNETPYKSIALSYEAETLDMFSLELIEQAIASCEKFEASKKPKAWSEEILSDFQLIDYDLIKNALGV